MRLREIVWWKWLVAVDGLLLLSMLVRPFLPASALRWHVFEQINLGREMNLAAWWSAACLLVLGLLAYELFCVRNDGVRWAWLGTSIILLGLSLDELGSLHERLLGQGIGGHTFFVLAAVALGILVYSVRRLLRRADTRKAGLLIAGGFALFATVAGQEFLEGWLTWPSWAMGLRATLEEGTELVAALLCFAALVGRRWTVSSSRGIGIAIPNPLLMRSLPAILLSGLVLTLGLSVFAGRLADIGLRGNPGVWYPQGLYVLLLCSVAWRAREAPDGNKAVWLHLAVFFLVSSVGTVYQSELITSGAKWYPGILAYLAFAVISAWRLLPSVEGRGARLLLPASCALLIGAVICVWASGRGAHHGPLLSGVYNAIQAFLVALFVARTGRRMARRDLLVLPLLGLCVVPGLAFDNLAAQFFSQGLFAYLVATLYLAGSLTPALAGAGVEREPGRATAQFPSP